MFPKITPARRPSTRSVRRIAPRGSRHVERKLKDRVQIGHGDSVDLEAAGIKPFRAGRTLRGSSRRDRAARSCESNA